MAATSGGLREFVTSSAAASPGGHSCCQQQLQVACSQQLSTHASHAQAPRLSFLRPTPHERQAQPLRPLAQVWTEQFPAEQSFFVIFP